MHSDQMRKDGISEPMIQGLYYDFVANYVKTRIYSTRYDAPGAFMWCNVLFSIVNPRTRMRSEGLL